MSKNGIKQIGGELFHSAYQGFIRLWKEVGGSQEIVETKDAVAFLVYHRDRRAVVFVQQWRPAVCEMLLEAPAGHIEAPPARMSTDVILETMAREAKEELGITISPDRIEFVNAMPQHTSPGILTERMWLGYMEIGEGDIENEERIFGVSEESEEITRYWIQAEVLETMLKRNIADMKTFALVQWFLREKYPRIMSGK